MGNGEVVGGGEGLVIEFKINSLFKLKFKIWLIVLVKPQVQYVQALYINALSVDYQVAKISAVVRSVITISQRILGVHVETVVLI